MLTFLIYFRFEVIEKYSGEILRQIYQRHYIVELDLSLFNTKFH